MTRFAEIEPFYNGQAYDRTLSVTPCKSWRLCAFLAAVDHWDSSELGLLPLIDKVLFGIHIDQSALACERTSIWPCVG